MENMSNRSGKSLKYIVNFNSNFPLLKSELFRFNYLRFILFKMYLYKKNILQVLNTLVKLYGITLVKGTFLHN